LGDKAGSPDRTRGIGANRLTNASERKIAGCRFYESASGRLRLFELPKPLPRAGNAALIC
jgi:hypothetical protein